MKNTYKGIRLKKFLLNWNQNFVDKMKKGKVKQERHITPGNSFGAEAPRTTKNRSRLCLCAVFSSSHLGQGTFAAQSPITCPKRQLPGTLYAMAAKRLKIDN